MQIRLMTSLWLAVTFTHMKQVIDAYIEKYGADNGPPPWQTFTIGNQPGKGNFHLIQKVFEGAFEVRGGVRLTIYSLRSSG